MRREYANVFSDPLEQGQHKEATAKDQYRLDMHSIQIAILGIIRYGFWRCVIWQISRASGSISLYKGGINWKNSNVFWGD